MSEIVSAPGKRARSKAANRQAILDAARRVFARIGYEAANVRDIIRETDLAAGTFYNYFRSKEEVFSALAEDTVRRFRLVLEDVRKSADTLEAYISNAYNAYFEFLARENKDNIEAGAPHIVLIGVRVDTPEMQAVAQEVKADIAAVLEREGNSQIDLDYLTAAAIGIARDMGDRMLLRRPVDVEGATTFATKILLAGIGAIR